MVFFGEKNLSANLLEKKIMSLKWAEQKYSVGTLGLKNYCFYRKKIMPRQLVVKKKNSAALQAKKNILTPKKP